MGIWWRRNVRWDAGGLRAKPNFRKPELNRKRVWVQVLVRDWENALRHRIHETIAPEWRRQPDVEADAEAGWYRMHQRVPDDLLRSDLKDLLATVVPIVQLLDPNLAIVDQQQAPPGVGLDCRSPAIPDGGRSRTGISHRGEVGTTTEPVTIVGYMRPQPQFPLPRRHCGGQR